MRSTKVRPESGWVLVSEDDSGERIGWYICWLEWFGTKKAALAFAVEHQWPKGSYRARRAVITVNG